MQHYPCVSMIMSVYNGAVALRQTIESVLEQSFQDFEYLIINDGSTDETAHILACFGDERIRVVHNEHNRGLPFSLNRGLSLAQGQYVARIDAGDWVVPERLEKQVAFLENHPSVGIVGTGCVVIDETGTSQSEERFPLTDLEIRWASLLKNPFLHPSVMLRRDILQQHQLSYDKRFHTSQDYELWTRLLQHTQGANLKELLTCYRISDASITVQRRNEQLRNHDAIAFRTIRHTMPDFSISLEQVSPLREAFVGGSIPKDQRAFPQVQQARRYLELLSVFSKKYQKRPEVKTLQQREALFIANRVFQFQFFQYWFLNIVPIVMLSPGFFFPLFRRKMRRILKRMRRMVQSRGQKRSIC